jgi:tRNA U34 5-methylaminomethyl-2-thiouridine-forming methyltransferase MnmC
MQVEFYLTADQSHTLYRPDLDETYHSRNGAVEESEYVFMQMGLLPAIETNNNLHLLEIGFGTGLNAILTLAHAQPKQVKVHYTSLETFPLSLNVIEQLNYGTFLSNDDLPYFTGMHSCNWNNQVEITPNFTLLKLQESLLHFTPNMHYDVIFFDAFAPNKQPELWTEAVFEKLFACLNPKGIFVTYSAKGEVRRLLKKVGFEVQLLPGPPRKRHMLRAIKP